MSDKNILSKKRKWYVQCFKTDWLAEPEFKNWLKQDENDPDSSYCKCCSITLKNANRSMLIKHSDSVKHKKSFEVAKGSIDITKFMTKKKSTETEQVAKSELLLSAYFAEHNIPFACIDHLIPVCKAAFPDSKIAEKLAMKRTKLAYVIQDGIAYDEKIVINDICRTQKFPIIIDESTDISITQVLAVVVRYFDLAKGDVVDALLDSVVVEDGTGLGLYNAVKLLLNDKNIPIENIIGFGSDNCSSMMGSKSGFQKLLKNDVPSVFIMGCICHSFALCASHAVRVLPSYLETFLKNITSYFSRSSKRQRDFSLIQEAVNGPCLKIPKLAQTRWLSRENVISAVLDQYPALLLYFQTESRTDKVDGANDIFKTLSNCGTKPILLFLQYVLQKVNKLNIEFQSEHFRLHVLYFMISSEYKIILSWFIKDEVILKSKLNEIDPSDVNIQKSMNEIYIGGKASAYLIREPFDAVTEKRFKNDCLKFLVELCIQMRKSFTFDDDSLIAKFNVLDPKVAPNLSTSPASIIPIAAHFPSLVGEEELNNLDDQWRSYRLTADKLSIPVDVIPQYWHKLIDIKDGLQNSKYDILSDFMTNLTVLPHSSACVERIFSLMNAVKTKQTNSLKAETVKNRILAKQLIARNKNDCTSWTPRKELIRDLESGAMNQRYLERVKKTKDGDSLTLTMDIDDAEDLLE